MKIQRKLLWAIFISLRSIILYIQKRQRLLGKYLEMWFLNIDIESNKYNKISQIMPIRIESTVEVSHIINTYKF